MCKLCKVTDATTLMVNVFDETVVDAVAKAEWSIPTSPL